MLIHQGWFTSLYTLHLLDSQSYEFEICIFPRETIPSQKYYMFMGPKCLQKPNNLDSLCYFHLIKLKFTFCINCTYMYMYLSVKRVNAIGENSNFSSKFRTEFHCASPIPYHMFLNCGYVHLHTDCSNIDPRRS